MTFPDFDVCPIIHEYAHIVPIKYSEAKLDSVAMPAVDKLDIKDPHWGYWILTIVSYALSQAVWLRMANYPIMSDTILL